MPGRRCCWIFIKASYPAKDEPYRSELAITAAASMANAVYEMGQQIGLVTNGRDAADRIRQEGWDYDTSQPRGRSQSGEHVGTKRSLATAGRCRPAAARNS